MKRGLFLSTYLLVKLRFAAYFLFMRKFGVFVVAGVLLAAGFFAGRFFIARDARQSAFFTSDGGSNATVAGSAAYRGELAKVLRVIDGDTVELANGDRVRYIGMDTPEVVDPRKPVQCFGAEAARRNKELVEGKSVRLEKDLSECDKYGRLLRYVYIEDGLPAEASAKAGTFVNLELVKEGYAAASTFPPDVKYMAEFAAAEKEARRTKRGLWGSCPSFGSPSASAAVTSSNATSPENANCVIKGNINSAGEKIYHPPGCPYYNKTKIDEARGERWFCSEAEAVAAGWRKAQNCL